MLVSTIIPTYNRARDVLAAVESALGQTYPADRHEILVVDDASTDDTAQVLAGFGSRIRYLRSPRNAGVSSARNRGIEAARGDAIAFLDSDDTWMPEKIARQVGLLEARPAVGLVLTSIQDVNADGSPARIFSRRSTLPEDGRVLRHVLRNPAMCPSSAMVRSAVLREVGGFDPLLRTAEDLDLHLRIALRYEVAVIDEPLIRYRRGDDGLAGSLRSYHDYVYVMERFAERHGSEVPPAELRAALFDAYLRNANGLLDHRAFDRVPRMAWRGLRLARNGRNARALALLLGKFARVAAVRALKGGLQARAP